GRRQGEGPSEVDVSPRSLVRDVGKRHEADEDRENANGHGHVEDPAPAEVVGEVAADGRTDDGRDAEDASKDALELRALGRRVQIADRREYAREQHAAKNSLDPPEGDQLRHVLGLPAERRREDKSDHPREKKGLAAEEVTELARDRGERGRRDTVCRRDPREVVETVEVGDDARQRRADDRLVERGEEEGQADTDRREDSRSACPLSG